MTARDLFRRMVRERRRYSAGSLDWSYRTRAARHYLNIIRGVPVTQWED